ncbi:MAG: glycosyltransferase family 2 protein [Acidimicrobiales bacterium]|nr:glycosyltransferase family 2 protein [Acidimicrobiales bacterium]
MTVRVSIVVPVYNEDDGINGFLDRLFDGITMPCEVLAVYDSPDDSTVPHLEAYARKDPRVVPTLNTYGKGAAQALRYGIDHAESDIVVVTMADGSDDPQQVEALVHLVERGVVVAAASRYAKGGQQVGGPWLKRIMSRGAGLSLYWLARVGTRDATNSFKAYDREFIRRVGVESDTGFELGLEMVAKARRYREPVAELPTIWLDRTVGQSNFQVWSWLPRYLRWYRYAFGPRLR